MFVSCRCPENLMQNVFFYFIFCDQALTQNMPQIRDIDGQNIDGLNMQIIL